MNHPKIKHAIAGENVGSNIPWSPAAELRLRREITIFWLCMWASAIMGWILIARMIAHHGDWIDAAWAALFAAMAIFNLFCVGMLRNRLGEEMRRLPNGDWFPGSGMLANKPRSTANLTEWMYWPAVHWPASSFVAGIGPREVDRFQCRCGAFHSFKKEGEWIPNHDPEQRADGTFPDIDPGGGRWVILCPCGIGHYKLRG